MLRKRANETRKALKKIDPKADAKRNLFWWIILISMILFCDIYLAIRKTSADVMIPCIMLTVFLGLVGCVTISRFYRDYLKPNITLEKTGDSTLERRIARNKKRMDGKDMYEVLKSCRRDYLLGMCICVGIIVYLLYGVVSLQLNQTGSIPFYWVIILTALIMGIAGIAMAKSEFIFVTEKDLKEAIQRRGLEEIHVNSDFMSATYHDVFKGVMAIGLNYYVVFQSDFCCVVPIRDITFIKIFSETETVSYLRQTTYYISIYEKGKKMKRFRCADRIAQELMAREFETLGLEVEEVGDLIKR